MIQQKDYRHLIRFYTERGLEEKTPSNISFSMLWTCLFKVSDYTRLRPKDSFKCIKRFMKNLRVKKGIHVNKVYTCIKRIFVTTD